MTWLGIDGGGTKTACTLYDESLQPLARTTFSTCHYAQAGTDGMACVFRDCLAWARRHGLDQDGGVGLGICGYGEGAESDRAIEAAVKAAVGTRPYALVNDVDAAWAAGLELADGIAVIAGTGSIALGVRNGASMRCGGWDYLLGDEGSGGWIGKEALRAFTRQSDGRDQRGPLYHALKRELDLADDFGIIHFAQNHLHDRTRIAALSVLVAQAAREGDASARRIYQQAAKEIAQMVEAIMRGLFAIDESMDKHGDGDGCGCGLNVPVPVTYIGGVFNAGDVLLDPLVHALPTRCRLVAPLYEPSLGPVLILRERLAQRDGQGCADQGFATDTASL